MYKRLVLFLLVGIHYIAIAQELSYNHYTVHDGLAQMQVEDLLLDSKGALWVATRGGVSRFNGYSFDSFEDLDIKPGFVSEIVEDQSGNIVFLGGKGLYIFDGIKFSYFNAPDKYSFNHMSSMDIDNEGKVWITAYRSSPLVFYDSSFIEFNELHAEIELDSVLQLYFHKPSNSLLANIEGKGLFKLSDSKVEQVFETSSLIFPTKIKGTKSNSEYVRAFEGSKSSIYSLDKNLKTTHHFDEYKGEIILMNEPLEEDFLFTDRPSNNLFLIENGKKSSIKLFNNLNSKFNYPGNPYFDENGNIYLESDAGLVVLNSNRFELLDKQVAPNVWTINQLENGDMFFGGYGSGVKIISSDGIEKELKLENEKYCENGSLQFQLGYVYMGGTKGLENDLIIPTQETLIKYSEGKFNLFDTSDECESMPSLYVFTDKKNRRILSATCNGLRILDKNGMLLRNVKEGLFDHRCLLTVNQNREGDYWIGATGGIAKYNFDTQQITNYTLENEGFPYKGVVCTYIDYRGTLWAGSREGLTYFDKDKDKFFALEGFKGMEVASMIAGAEKQLFLSTAGALVEANLESFYKDGKMLHRVFDKNSGLGIIGSGQNGFFKDRDGKIWCTSDTEVYTFHPENLTKTTNVSQPNIVKINGERVSLESKNKAIEIPKDDNSLSIEFESVGLNASNNLTYSYMLEDYDDEWSEYAKYTNCTYNNLGSGSYIFKVKNNQSDLIAVKEIKIEIPFYKEPYFGGFAGIASVGFLLLSILFGRNYKLEKRNNKLLKIQEQQIQTEKQNLELLHRLEKENKALLEKQNKKLVFQKSELEELNKRLQVDIAAIKKGQSNKDQRLKIRTKGKLNYVLTNELMYIHAEENGCRYFMKDRSSIWNDDNLKSWEEKLDPKHFVRIHRATLVQKEYISKITYNKLNLVDGTELKVGRKYKENL